MTTTYSLLKKPFTRVEVSGRLVQLWEGSSSAGLIETSDVSALMSMIRGEEIGYAYCAGAADGVRVVLYGLIADLEPNTCLISEHGEVLSLATLRGLEGKKP